MKKRFTFISVAAIVLALTASADNMAGPRFVPAKQTAKNIARNNLKQVSAYAAAPLKVQQNASGVMEAIIVNEDFSALTSGTVEKPDTTKMLACEYDGYSDNGIFIDNSLTKDGTWFGSQVYSAGGALALKTYNPQQMAYVCTPIGDYSGDLTISLRVKANPALVRTDEGYMKLSGSSIGIEVCYGGYDEMVSAKTDDSKGNFDERVYEKDGWQEVTYTLKNYSANSDGYVYIFTEGSIVIDDVKIKAGNSFIAQPVINGIVDFQKDNFTVSWQPMRKAYNYYVDLYTRKYLSDKDTTFVADFNDGKLPDGFESSSATYSDDEGADGSKGLVLKNGDTFVAPTNGNDYKSLHFYLKTIDRTVDSSDPYAEDYVEGSVLVDLMTADGWINIGEYYASSFWKDGSVVKVDDEYDKFKSGGFTQLRLRAAGLNKGAYVVLDNVDITAKPAFEYEIVNSDYGTDLSSNYCMTDITGKTQYTFTGLDPNTEYWYGVRSHYVSLFSDRQFIHGLGVAVPNVKAATDIDSRGSFTANWESVPKATGYTVTCYGVTTLDKADDDYPILEEDFGKIDASMTTATSLGDATPLDNSEVSSLDAYTTTPGWSGKNNALVQGMLAAEGDFSYTGGMITTPQLYLANSDECRITVKLYGEAGDNIVVKANGKNYYLPVPDNGYVDGSFLLPITEPRQSFKFHSYSKAPFAIDYIKIGQNLPAGANTMTWLANGDTDAETTSYVFTGLDAYDYPKYGYDVTSHFQYDDNTSVSSLTPSEAVFVDLATGQSTGITEQLNNSVTTVVARYTADGQLVSAPVKGLNILKMSNGKTVKVIVK